MKETITQSFKLLIEDRLMATLLVVLLLAGVAYCIFVGLSLHPSDLQVAVHYTAFGQTTFYRDKWYYFIGFIVFGLIVTVLHPLLAIKLYEQGRRQIALFFIALSLFIVIVTWFLTVNILKIAFL